MLCLVFNPIIVDNFAALFNCTPVGRASDSMVAPTLDEVSVVTAHLNDLPVKISVCVSEGQDKLTTMYWLPKLHKRPYKARFIANSCSCTTTELSKLLTSCLTAIKSHVIRYCETVYETSNKNWFWSIKNSGEVPSKLKCRGLRATSLSTYDFSTLYTTLPHKLIKENFWI